MLKSSQGISDTIISIKVIAKTVITALRGAVNLGTFFISKVVVAGL